MRFHTIAALLAALVLTACAHTPRTWQPLASTALDHPLGLVECIQMAEQQDLRTAEWKARHGAAAAAVQQAWTPPNPTLNLGWEDIGLKDEATGKSATASTYGVSYPILFWVTRPWDIAAAKHHRIAEEAAMEVERRDLAIEVGTAWFELAALERKRDLLAERITDAEKALRYARIGESSGESSHLDMERAEAELLAARAEAMDSEHEERSAKLAFAFALGADRPIYPSVLLDSTDLPTTSTLPREQPSRPDLPEIRAAEEESIAAHFGTVGQYARIMPFTDVQASGSRKNALDGMSSAYAFDIPIPLFDWNLAGIATAKAEQTLAEIASERARRDGTQRIAHAYDTWQYSRAKYLELMIPLRARSISMSDAAQRLFESGQITFSEFLQAHRESSDGKIAAIDGWRDARVSEWVLLNLVGSGTQQKP